MERVTRSKVAVTILTYNSAEHVTACIDSVLAQTVKGIDLVIVDNASDDDTVKRVTRKHPKVPVVRQTGNLGFACAHNEAIRRASAEYYLALNPDCWLAPDYVERLVSALARCAEAGYAVGKIRLASPSEPPRIYSAGHCEREDGMVLNRGYDQIDRTQYDREECVWGANGSAALCSMEMLECVRTPCGQYFDELFFLYGVDVDLDYRAHRAGYKCLYVPDALATHAGAASGGVSSGKLRRRYFRDMNLVHLKNAPWPRFFRRMLLPMLREYGRFALGDPAGAAISAVQTAALLPRIVCERRQQQRRFHTNVIASRRRP